VVFHRVIEGFMAQTGDVKFGKSGGESFDPRRAGMGGSDKADLKAEFSNMNHGRGTCSMARAQDPNSANSQFFICFDDAGFLNANTRYGARSSKAWTMSTRSSAASRWSIPTRSYR
jgi:cyclophilin family peptidyl-prolyl cis-trans isomerase